MITITVTAADGSTAIHGIGLEADETGVKVVVARYDEAKFDEASYD